MDAERLEGNVSGIIFRNEENNYSVISVAVGRKEYTATGTLPALAVGEQIILEGNFTEHPNYGKQFKISSFEVVLPSDRVGIERFLASGLIKGIKKQTARQIVDAFGVETLDVLDEHPERLAEIKGLGKKRWRIIAESYRSTIHLRKAMVFLTSYGISSSTATKIAKRYGDQTELVIRENPYRLCTEVDGIGFLTADRIASSLGISRESTFRLKAGILYTLQEQSATMGHCYLPMEELLHRSCELLHVPLDLLPPALEALSVEDSVTCEKDEKGIRVYLPWFYHAEEEVAQRLCSLYRGAGKSSREKGELRLRDFERTQGITFSEKQKEAILCALEFGVLVITGGPGTGKTTIIRCIISLLQHEGSVTLCAPTGRAAKRMSETTGRKAATIHRLLQSEGEGSFAKNADDPLETNCIIVDEMSMVDLMLMRALLRAIRVGTRLILVGDADQLPSVGAGNVLGDILASNALPAVRLTDIYRQSEQSRIVVNAHRINHGELPLLNEKKTDFFFDRRETPQTTRDTIVDLMQNRLPAFLRCPDAMRAQTIQVLAPMKKGETGVYALNEKLQEALNPPDPAKPTLEYNHMLFRVGDKVMQTHNDYSLHWTRASANNESETEAEGDGVFNGDLGIITQIDREDKTMTVLFDDDREVVYNTASGEMENLDLAYAMSVHKSQGSEFPVVIIPVWGGPRMLLTRNLFYTALTRAKQMVVLVGREVTIRDMVANNHIARRYTTLTDCLYAESARPREETETCTDSTDF